MGENRIEIGTSSWADPGFVEEWYPADVAARDRLAWYAEQFDAVEVNSTFYAIPGASTVARWAQVTPDHFTFDIKLHRLLSRHAAREDSLPKALREGVRLGPRGRVLLDDRLEASLVEATLAAVAPLVEAGKLSAFLLQCSPAFAPREHDLDELASLVKRLAPLPLAVELRHRGWVSEKRVERTLGWFAERGVAWVGVDAPVGDQVTIMPALDAATRDDVAYLRAHGRNHEGYVRGKSVAERFAHRYRDSELREIGERARWLAERAERVRLMFNNNRGSDAPVAAQRMKEMLGQGARV